jgi:AraC family transcriptional regulator of adaptative response / DNA-3-methyladenine glycosylase II
VDRYAVVVRLLAYQPPLDWLGTLAFLRARAIPGLESVDACSYRRGDIRVSLGPSGDALAVEGPVTPADLQRIRRIFDLDADPSAVAAVLGRDPLLRFQSGLRVPGGWDPFELGVRAILGQQITVKAATTMAGRIQAAFGVTPSALANADLTQVGLTRSRSATIRCLAEAVLDGAVTFEAPMSHEAFVEQITRVRGIGPWTAQYIAMRARKFADAFPAEDLILLRAASTDGVALTPKRLIARAEAWRPWRSYAVIALWRKYMGPQ